MPAHITARLSRLALVGIATIVFGATAVAPAAAADSRPAPEVGALPPATLNLFKPDAFRYQDPNYAACTATSALVMLNTIALAGNGGPGFRWVPRLGSGAVDSILQWERTNDTLEGGKGSDPHGWRNALNYYGWGPAAMSDPAQRVYDDRAYGSFDGALKGAVTAIARFRKPVGLLAWAGGHAQVVTGYVASGEDPATSDNFVVNGLWVSDVLASSRLVNRYINRLSLKSGDVRYRFQSYREVDSPLDDPYSVGWRRSSVRSTTSEWYRRWVLVIPVRDGAPAPDPTPTPEPTPTPPPDPTPTPEPTPTEEASPPPASPTATPTSPEATPSEAPAG